MKRFAGIFPGLVAAMMVFGVAAFPEGILAQEKGGQQQQHAQQGQQKGQQGQQQVRPGREQGVGQGHIPQRGPQPVRTPPPQPPQGAPATDPKVTRPELRPAPGFTRGDSPAKA